MTAELKRTSQGKTLVLTLSNPEHRNALGPEIYIEGIEALGLAESSADIRSVVIVGEGSLFSAVDHLQHLQARRPQPASDQAQSVEALHNWIEAIRTFPKPVIAAIEGHAIDAGFSLALACDFMVAADNAVFVMAYSDIALSPAGGASWSLARALPRQLMAELLMCGERITAQRLHALGLVNRVTPPGTALTEALTLAAQLNERAPNALASIKTLINEAVQATLVEQLASEHHHFVRNLHHANAGIAMSALLSQTAPRFE